MAKDYLKDKKFIEEQKNKLLAEKEKLEKSLASMAVKNKKNKDDWIAKYPKMGQGELVEVEEDEFEEYDSRLPISYTLELELKKVNEALERIERNKYGICQKCGNPIAKGRLTAYPQAKLCKKCQKLTSK